MIGALPRAVLVAAASMAILMTGVACTTTRTAVATYQGPGAPPRANSFDHVLIIVLENQDYDFVRKDNAMGALESEGASFSDFHGLFHPSYPNYLSMVCGKALNPAGD